jgi:hypothetical protein
LQALLDRKASVNAKNQNSETPIINAATMDNADAVRTLLRNGADIHVRRYTDQTALELAQDKGFADVIKAFEEARDPVQHFRGLAEEMKSAMFQMQSQSFLSQGSAAHADLARTYERVAEATLMRLDDQARINLVDRALTNLRRFCCQKELRPQSQVLHELTLVLLFARRADGKRLLYEAGASEIPFADEWMSLFRHRSADLQDLRQVLGAAGKAFPGTSSWELSHCSTEAGSADRNSSRSDSSLDRSSRLDCAQGQLATVTPSHSICTPVTAISNISLPSLISRSPAPAAERRDETTLSWKTVEHIDTFGSSISSNSHSINGSGLPPLIQDDRNGSWDRQLTGGSREGGEFQKSVGPLQSLGWLGVGSTASEWSLPNSLYSEQTMNGQTITELHGKETDSLAMETTKTIQHPTPPGSSSRSRKIGSTSCSIC